MISEFMKAQLLEAVGDSGNIASSAVVLLTNRCQDLDINPLLALMALRVLVEKNIEEQMHQARIGASHVATRHGQNPDDAWRDVKAFFEQIEADYKTKIEKVKA